MARDNCESPIAMDHVPLRKQDHVRVLRIRNDPVLSPSVKRCEVLQTVDRRIERAAYAREVDIHA